jgi:hypothetical protein
LAKATELAKYSHVNSIQYTVRKQEKSIMLRLAIAIPESREPPYGSQGSFGRENPTDTRTGDGCDDGVVATPAPTSKCNDPF